MPEREQWCTEENLVPMYDNDNLLWMLESYLEEKTILKIDTKATNLSNNYLSEVVMEGDWNTINQTFTEVKRQASVEAILLTPFVENSIFKAYIEKSKINTVKEVN